MFSTKLTTGWLFILLLCAICNAQAQLQEEWRFAFTSTALRDYVADANGNIILATSTNQPDGHGGFISNLQLQKLGTNGHSAWSLNLGPFSSSTIASKMLVLDAAGNACVATERTNSAGYLLRKINAEGQLVWQVLVPLAVKAAPTLALDAFGNLCMGGIVDSNNVTRTFWFGAYAPNGSNLWQTNFAIGTNVPMELIALTSSSDNHCIFCVSDSSFSTTRRVVGRLAQDGSSQWVTPLEQTVTAIGRRTLFAGENGAVYLSGNNLAKLDASGTLLWLNTNATDIVKVEPNGELFASRRSGGNGAAILMRFNANGDVLWKQAFPQQPFSVVPASGGRWLAAAVNDGWWGELIRIVSYDQAGEQFWQTKMTNVYQPSYLGIRDLAGVSDGTVRLIAQIGYPFGGNSVSCVIALREVPVSGLPHITSQPTNATRSVGQAVWLGVEADGNKPLSYQWFRNGQPIPSQQAPVWSWTTGSVDDSGDYFVEVSNSAGRIYSKVATLRVLQPPSGYESTTDISAALNQQVSLWAGVHGSEPLLYQWYLNGTPLPGGTNAFLPLENVKLSGSGLYAVRASNDVGTYLRTVAQLQVTASVTQEWALFETNLNFRYELGLSVNQDGSVYFLRGERLSKISAGGEGLWETSGYYASIASDGSDGIIALGSRTTRYSFNGTPLWDSTISFLHEPPFPWNDSFVGFYDSVRVLDGEGELVSLLAPELTNTTFNYVQKLKKSPDGGLICSAVASDTNDVPILFLAKWNANAEQVWTARLLEGQEFVNLRGYDFAVAPDGRLLVSTLVFTNWTRKQRTTCFDSAGRTLWQASYDTGFSESEVHVAVDNAGNTIVISQGAFVKYDTSGNRLWVTSSGHPSAGVISAEMVRLDSLGNIYILGNSISRKVVEKLSPDGNSLWVASLPPNDYGTLEVSPDGSIYVAGASWDRYVFLKLRNLENPFGPSIVHAPTPALAARHPGESVTFTGEVAGAPPLRVRWLREPYHWNGPAQADATNLSLVLTNLSYWDPGEYFLEVRNDYGVVCSRAATLKVGLRPDFLFSQYDDQNWYLSAEYLRVNEGSLLKVYTINQSVTADDTWQWYLNGVLIPGATSPTLILPGVIRTMAGTITAHVTNIFGSAEHSIPLYVDTSVRTIFETTEAAGRLEGGWNQSPRLAVNKVGEIYLLGAMNSDPSDPWSPPSWFLQKHTASGTRVWQVDRPTSRQNTTAPWLRLDADGSLIVSASREEASGLVPWITKISPSGAILWESKLAPAASHTRDVTAMVLGNKGEIYTAGLDLDQAGATKVFVSSVATATGKANWTLLFPAGELSWLAYAPGLAPYPNGGVCLASARGLTRILNTGAALWTVGTNFLECAVDPAGAAYGVGYHSAKYSLNGWTLWRGIQPGLSPHADAYGLVTASTRLEWTVPAIRKQSRDGTPLWTSPAEGNELVTGADGSIFISGGYYGPVTTKKLDASGAERWAASPNWAEGWNSRGAALALCTNGDLVVAHLLLNATNGTMYMLARYQDAVINQSAHLVVTPTKVVFQAGKPVTLTAAVSGASKYRVAWYKDGQPLPGQTNLALHLTGATSDTGQYQAYLFTTNQALASVEVPVLKPYPYFDVVSRYNGTRLLLPQTENWAYPAQIQVSTNLLHWTDYQGPFYPGMTIPISTNQPAAFYRAIQYNP